LTSQLDSLKDIQAETVISGNENSNYLGRNPVESKAKKRVQRTHYFSTREKAKITKYKQ